MRAVSSLWGRISSQIIIIIKNVRLNLWECTVHLNGTVHIDKKGLREHLFVGKLLYISTFWTSPWNWKNIYFYKCITIYHIVQRNGLFCKCTVCIKFFRYKWDVSCSEKRPSTFYAGEPVIGFNIAAIWIGFSLRWRNCQERVH
jgi:hypothetical protein